MNTNTAVPAPQASVESHPVYSGEDPRRFRINVTTIGDLLLSAADRHGDKPALIFPDETVSYNQLAERALHAARGLQALGVGNRDHVGILMHSCVRLAEMFFAVSLCGAVPVTINPRYRPSELAYLIENADLVTVVTSDELGEQVDFVARLAEALPGVADQPDPLKLSLAATPRLRNLLVTGSSAPAGFIHQRQFDALAETVDEIAVHHARVRTRVRDTGLILYTSGTTANPKGCLLSHEAMVRNAMATVRHRYLLNADDIAFSALPLYHIAALKPMLGMLEVGGTFVAQGHFEPGECLRMMEQNRVTAVFLPFVTFLQGLLYHPDFATTDLSSVRIMNSCFAAQPKSVGEAYRKAMPGTMQMGTFGMTEASGFVATGVWGMDEELGYTRLGLPLLGVEVRIVDAETGQDVGTDVHGEVLVRGFNLFDGYYRDPVKTAEALDADGWFHTGDIGSLDGNGHIMFHGRLKDMLKVGGENVAAAEIEEVLTRHPAVKLAQVVGIPDAKYAEVPAAFVELAPGQTATEQELIDLCRREIAGFKVPRHVRFVTEWPMSASKIQRFKLRRELIEELGIDPEVP
ncbi:MAG: class I adenylate-forming enzyme family protein [Porticoccaceae bacterium]|jgi:acyl-CoA synthetase (AMP-forming)/AMP-acid ligase II|nr:class I adenylate-forming enzyme family protein [Porticoccaceae bacterium]HLS99439.1 class I adenylate-forming enzyme family protein [Porticoccaceae bacterium]